ncbi:MAG: tetratricopeptide repeat protein [Pyrinomonadaceae bacterium]
MTRKLCRATRILIATLLVVTLNGVASGQVDEIRQATGLPIPIGASVIYGRVSIRNLARNEPRPIIFVTLYINGAQIDRRETNDRGYFYFLASAQDGAKLVVEASGIEMGTAIITGGTSTSVRQDLVIDWLYFRNRQARPSTISAANSYQRSAENETAFEQAMEAEKEPEKAIDLYLKIVTSDPKDHPAWTQLGTLYRAVSKDSDAEKAYLKAIELKPDYHLALMNLGKLYFAKKAMTNAAVIFFRATEVDSTSAEAFHFLGETYLQLKQGSKAVVALNEALRLDPARIEIHFRLAKLYNAAGLKDRAAEEYKSVLAKEPDHPDKGRLKRYIKENAKPAGQ